MPHRPRAETIPMAGASSKQPRHPAGAPPDKQREDGDQRQKVPIKIALSCNCTQSARSRGCRLLLPEGPNDIHGIKRKCERRKAGQEEAKT